MKRAFKILLIFVCIFLVLFLTLIFYYIGVTKGERLDRSKLELSTSCVRIYDGAGEAVETAGKLPAATSFPQTLSDAFVAVEDKNFYRHNGFDYKRIVKAALKNVASFSFREGASTISQQLIKNTHLSGEKTIKRKLKEYKLTRALEKNYSKQQILELYINSIYFGHSAFGVSNAAQFYFAKQVDELDTAECAMLAALVKSPNRYSPFRNADKCLARRNLVLRLMREQNYITDAEYAQALEEPLPTEPATTSENAYLTRVYEELAQLFPDAQTDSKLHVYTFYDRAVQAELQSIDCDSDMCILVRDVNTHGIKAFRSTVGTPKRQPASTIKPLLVYAPAMEEGLICPLTPILDERTDFSGYCPDDSNGASGQYISVRKALAKSVNIPAVKILNELGVERAEKYLNKMGLGIDESDYSLALALGGMRNGFTLPALADGYATLACGGEYAPSQTIAYVTNEKGKVLYRFTPNVKRIFSEEVSYLTSDMLKTAVKEGTAKTLASLPYSVAAKTGTNEVNGQNVDAYSISYTSHDVVAVWLGNRDNSPVQATGGGLPTNYALRIYRALYKDSTPEDFNRPHGILEAEYDLEEYEHNHRILLADELAPVYTKGFELFVKSAMPKEISARFTHPTIEKPTLSVKNGAVYIDLCQTKYYDYIVKRENRGKETTIYQGKYQKTICDNSVRSGESYRYTVIPVFNGSEGEAVVLPSVTVKQQTEIPNDWWD